MTSQRLNVLVYTGPGATVESVKHCIWSLRRLLSPNYAVIPITGEAVLNEPWTATCALFVMPGGADLGYCRTLNGAGNRRILQFVNQGGSYLGLCAGGYYGSARCEFETGKPGMEVVGDRELAFFPGTCRGLAYPGFVYHSEIGTKAAAVHINKTALLTTGGAIPDTFRAYYNGGGVFVDASKYQDRGVEVLAEYVDKVAVDSGSGQAAVVYRKVGAGHAILTSNHPEFAAANLSNGEDNPEYPSIVAALQEDDKQRIDFMKACLSKLNLKVNQDPSDPPSLSRLHLTAMKPSDLSSVIKNITSKATTEGGKVSFDGDADTFLIEQRGAWALSSVKAALPVVVQNAIDGAVGQGKDTAGADIVGIEESTNETEKEPSKMIDYGGIVKRLVLHASDIPDSKETPYFNHHAFFANLDRYDAMNRNETRTFGHSLLYGEVVTSTNTMLEKNTSLLSRLPSGLTFTATTQVAGRGRGSNVWVSPPGSLMFSTIVRHPLALASSAPVVWIQYLLALSIITGIQTYDKGYTRIPVRLKWPNDIYALVPDATTPPPSSTPFTDAQRRSFVKIGGILISTSYNPASPHYTLICGVGLNLGNTAPTTSLNQLASAAGLPPFTPEKLLASILSSFEVLYAQHFCDRGFDRMLMTRYTDTWLHTGQMVTLDPEAETAGAGQEYVGGAAYREPEKCRVKGISSDWGLLVVEQLVGEEGRERTTGKTWELQSDSNSFDFFKGLLKKKT